MKKFVLMIVTLMAGALLVSSCAAPAANNATANTGNKAANTATAPAADKAAVEGDLKKMMEDFSAALNKGDADAIGKMYSDDYTLIDATGAVQTKTSRLEAIKSGKIKMEGLKFNDLKIKTNPSGDGAVITGRVSGKTITDGKTEEANSMVTWVVGKTKDKGWQFVNAQITNVEGSAAKSDDSATDVKAPATTPAANK